MESLAADLLSMQRVPLPDPHVALIAGIAEERTYEPGDILVRPGDPMDTFVYVLDGEIEVVDPQTNERAMEFTLGPTQYMGEIAFLSGGAWANAMRAIRPTRVLAAPREAMLDLMARVPELSDAIVTVFAARRRRVVEAGQSALTLIGAEGDRAVGEIASFASRNKIPVASFALGTNEARAAMAKAGLPADAPAVLFGDERLEDPTPRRVAKTLGLDMPLAGEDAFDVVIVGGGPAGIAAAVYAGAEGLRALVVEDAVIGGQAGSSSRIENYMGFPTGISGADLTFRGEIQAMRMGTRFVMPRRVDRIEGDEAGYCLTLDDGERVHARAVVIATGVQYRRLPLDRLEEFEGAGIYYAATELEARRCRGADAVVIGGGNSAGQAAMFLSRSAPHVHVLVRGEGLAASMSVYLSNRLERDPKITVHYRTEVAALHGEADLEAVTLRNSETKEVWRQDTRALFVMVGAAPNTGWLEGVAALDERGFVQTGEDAGAASPFGTSAPGVFAVGDVRAGSVKRVASGVGEGSVVISHVWSHVHRDG